MYRTNYEYFFKSNSTMNSFFSTETIDLKSLFMKQEVVNFGCQVQCWLNSQKWLDPRFCLVFFIGIGVLGGKWAGNYLVSKRTVVSIKTCLYRILSRGIWLFNHWYLNSPEYDRRCVVFRRSREGKGKQRKSLKIPIWYAFAKKDTVVNLFSLRLYVAHGRSGYFVAFFISK